MKIGTSWLFTLSLVVVALTATACDSDSNGGEEGIGPPENITRIIVTLQTGDGANVAMYTASDPEGSGTMQAQTITVLNGVTYEGSIELFDDDIANATDRNITEEISEERDGHRFFFTYTADEGDASRVSVVPSDMDNNGLPVGLEFQLTTTQGGVAAGNLNVVLSHFADQSKGASPGAQTDVSVSFPLVVQ